MLEECAAKKNKEITKPSHHTLGLFQAVYAQQVERQHKPTEGHLSCSDYTLHIMGSPITHSLCLLQAVYAQQVKHQPVAGLELGAQRLWPCLDDFERLLSTLKPTRVREGEGAAQQ